MPDRMVRDGWKTSRRIGQISEGAETLFVRLILSACNLSRYHADPAIIKATAYTNRPRLRTSDIVSRLDELEKAGLIVRYAAPDGTPLLEIPRFGQLLKYGLKSPFAPRAGAPPEDPGQGRLDLPDLPPPSYSQSAPEPEIPRAAFRKRSEAKSPQPPAAAGGELSELIASRKAARQYRSAERAGEELRKVETELQDLLYPGGSAWKVTPTGDKKTRYDVLMARRAELLKTSRHDDDRAA